jgi:putative ABC transport system permease protein
VLIGTWYRHEVTIPKGGGTFTTGVASTNPWWHVDGRWFSDEAAECVVGAALARRAGIAVGQTLDLRAGDRTVQLRVVGIAATGGQEDDAVLAPLAIGAATRRSSRPISPPAGKRADQTRGCLLAEKSELNVAGGIRELVLLAVYFFHLASGAGTVAWRRGAADPAIAEGEGRILTRVSALMWLVTLGALLAAALAVAATAATTVLERAQEIGLMKALGAPRIMVGAFFLGEQWLLALFGGASGYVVGLGLARFVGERIFGVTPELRLILLPIVLGVAAVVATLGSLAPLRTVLRLDPAPVLRGE